MSHARSYSGRMKSKSLAARSRRSPALIWSHLGRLHRLGLWPEVTLERENASGDWEVIEPDPMDPLFVSAAVMIDARRWKSYAEFMPTGWVRWAGGFGVHRMLALVALARCPRLSDDFADLPVLALLVAAHTMLRGQQRPAWTEINAVREREGVHGVLDWLGLPATSACLEELAELPLDSPLPKLEAIRSLLWQQHHAATEKGRRERHWGNALAA